MKILKNITKNFDCQQWKKKLFEMYIYEIEGSKYKSCDNQLNMNIPSIISMSTYGFYSLISQGWSWIENKISEHQWK